MQSSKIVNSHITGNAHNAHHKLQLTCEEWALQVYQKKLNKKTGYIAFHVHPDFCDVFENSNFKLILSKTVVFNSIVISGKAEGEFIYPVPDENSSSLQLGVFLEKWN